MRVILCKYELFACVGTHTHKYIHMTLAVHTYVHTCIESYLSK